MGLYLRMFFLFIPELALINNTFDQLYDGTKQLFNIDTIKSEINFENARYNID